jgi:hypothetical protein
MSRARDEAQHLRQLRQIILPYFLDNSPCNASEYFKSIVALQALGHRRFSSKCSRLLAFPCAENHIIDHVVHSTVFQIIGSFTTPVLRLTISKIVIFDSCWASVLGISQIRLSSFIPMPRAAFSAVTIRSSSRLVPGLLLLSLSSSGFSSSSIGSTSAHLIMFSKLSSMLGSAAPSSPSGSACVRDISSSMSSTSRTRHSSPFASSAGDRPGALV